MAESKSSQGAHVRTATVEETLEAIRLGRPVLVVDDLSPENEGSLVAPAEGVTAELTSFFIRHTSGLLCVAMTGDRLQDLGIPLMGDVGPTSTALAFAVAVDARDGVTTGISARDRAATIRTLAGSGSTAEDLIRPGHVLPLRSCDGGVLKRAARTEAAVDLAVLAGRAPAGLIAAVMDDDGSVARVPRLLRFAEEHHLPLLSITDLVSWRFAREKLVENTGSWPMPTRYGDFTASAYTSLLDGTQHLALVCGDLADGADVLVRVHAECLSGDTLGGVRCECGAQLDAALRMIAAEGRGALVYLRGQEGRSLAHAGRDYRLRKVGNEPARADGVDLPADSREYGLGAQILADIGVRGIRLITDNPAGYEGLSGFGLQIVERIPMASAGAAQASDFPGRGRPAAPGAGSWTGGRG